MLAVIISATITITDVCNSTYKLIAEWNNIHKTPLSESHQTDQKEPKVETETPVTNLGHTFESIFQMLAHEMWTKPKDTLGGKVWTPESTEFNSCICNRLKF